MPAQIDAIQEFPKDGRRWWIRWIDHYQVNFKGTATRGVSVWLWAIPDRFSGTAIHRLPTANLIAECAGSHQCTVLVGMIPRLMLGAIFQDQIQIGQLPFEIKTFRFSKKRCYNALHKASEDMVPIRKPWMKHKFSPVSTSFYALGAFSDSRCIVLHQDETTLVLPCQEVFRTLYAPERRIALAITRGIWDSEWKQVANPKWTCLLPDGSWSIVLRLGIDKRFARILANLILGDTGRRAANNIYSRFVDNPNRARIASDFPFDWEHLEIRVRCIRQTPTMEKYLAFGLEGVHWPDLSRKIWYDLDNSNTEGETITPIDKPRPFSTSQTHIEQNENPTLITSEDDPMQEAGLSNFISPGIELIGASDPERMVKEESHTYQRFLPTVGGGELPAAASSGEEGHRDSGLSRAGYAALERVERPPRFVQVVEMLNQLIRDKQIDNWQIERPNRPGHWRGDLEVWPIPLPTAYAAENVRPPAWFYIDPSSRLRRTALVCRVTRGTVTVYWIELETRLKGEGFRYILFVCRETLAQGVISTLLNECSDCRGVWPSDDDLVAVSGAVVVQGCRHSYNERQRSVKSDHGDILSAGPLMDILCLHETTSNEWQNLVSRTLQASCRDTQDS
jgi:hypothetical protein